MSAKKLSKALDRAIETAAITAITGTSSGGAVIKPAQKPAKKPNRETQIRLDMEALGVYSPAYDSTIKDLARRERELRRAEKAWRAAYNVDGVQREPQMTVQLINKSGAPYMTADPYYKQVEALRAAEIGVGMNILIACEESQAVCTEMRRLGHRAFSCDLMECSGGYPEWHIQGDVLPLLNGDCTFQTADTHTHTQAARWDMIIAFPPCTKTSNAGARHLYKGGKLNMKRFYEGLCGKALIDTILHADCDRIAVENPQPSKVFGFERPTQCIEPFQFGHPFTKKTMLWLKGLPDLMPTNVVVPERTWCPSGSYSGKHNDKHRGMFTTDRARNRAKTFPGIARAMAEQWAGCCKAR